MPATTFRIIVSTLAATTLGVSLSAIAQSLPSTPPSHVVVVIMENHAAAQIFQSPKSAQYINGLAKTGAVLTNSSGVSHPSEPNYLALFSGSTHGIDGEPDPCPLTLSGPNLAAELANASKTFVGYSEGLPATGSTECNSATGYARKHAPWVNFSELPSSVNQPFSAFPKDYAKLPTVAFVVPSLGNDMHDGTIAQGDTWLRKNIDAYVRWAKGNNALLIVTWDEDDEDKHNNRIPTIFYGPMVKPGASNQTVNHYSVLRTIEDLYQLPHAGNAASAEAIDRIWK